MEGMRNFHFSETAFLNVARNSVDYNTYARSVARKLKYAAIASYVRRAKGDGRFSETSPPRYLSSWRISGSRGTWVLANVDPGALWVEFGAHAGGVVEVLKYRPLGTAIDIVSSGGGDG